MKVAITGHTSGIGKAVYEHFQSKGWEVVGMSRTNGYHIIDDQEKIIEQAADCDLFINNANDRDGQLSLLKALYKKVPKIITMGSISTEFPEIFPKAHLQLKNQLHEFSKNVSLLDRDNVAKTLLIMISFAERTYNLPSERIDSDYTISYKEITNVIDFWLENTNIREVEFAVKLTNKTIEEIKKHVDHRLLDQYLERIEWQSM
jgi:hypothetical protein